MYVEETSEQLRENVQRLIAELESRKAKFAKRGRTETHPARGMKTATLEYTITLRGAVFKYRETAVVQKGRLYRLVLVAAESTFEAGEEPYEQMVSSLSFEK